MPIGFIICGLLLTYVLFDTAFRCRWACIFLLTLMMAGYFVPSINCGVYIVNPVLFLMPIIVAVVSCRNLKVREWIWMLTVVFMTILEYMFIVKINNNLSLNMSSDLLVLVVLNLLFVPRRTCLPFVVVSVSVLQLVSGVFENVNQIHSFLGSTESLDFMILTIVIYGMIWFAIKSLRKNRNEVVQK